MRLLSVLVLCMVTGFTTGVNVVCPVKRYVVILFQPVTLQCRYTTTGQLPAVLWKYKSFCQDPVQAALNPSSAQNAIAQTNTNYNPNIQCLDSSRTVRLIASKNQNSITLSNEYQGRKISITGDADLNIAQTAWGDSGVYICSVTATGDLSGNGEDYTELIVLDWLLVVLVVLGFLLLLLLIGICWCQCCPHTCCCYVRCPCCPERCCCPRALYEAGKAVKAGVPSQVAASIFAPSLYGQPVYVGGAQPAIPMLPVPHGVVTHPPNGYGMDFDAASSVGHGSQVPLLRDNDSGVGQTRSGYRVQANQDGNPTRLLYYMEREVANLDPSHPGGGPANYSRPHDALSEISSLHDGGDPRNRGRSRPPQLNTVYDNDNMSTISSVSQNMRRDEPRRGDGFGDHRGRARSMENLDDLGRNYRGDYPPRDRGGRRGSDDEWSSSGRAYDRVADDRSRRDYSPEDRRRADPRGPGLQGRRSRSRDDLMELERGRGGGGRDTYDDNFLREAMERKKLGEQQRSRSREYLDSGSERSDRNRGPHGGPPPLPLSRPAGNPDHHRPNTGFPPPPSYTEDTDSLASSKKSNLRKNGAVSRESLVV